LSVIVILMLLLWGGATGAALLVARDRLSPEATGKRPPSLWDEALARGVAFLAASIALATFGLIGAIVTNTGDILLAVPPAWALSALPLVLPSSRDPGQGFWRSSQGLVLASVLLTAASVAGMALWVLVRLLLARPSLT
jgi:hypothetical protein